jgi:hypothetical protein
MRTNFFKANKVPAAILSVFCALLIIAGCQQGPAAPSKSGTDVIKDGMKKLMEVTSGNYDVALKADIQDKDAGSTKIDVTFGGVLDIKDQQDPKISLKLSGSGSSGEANGANGALELRLNKTALFFNLMSLEMKGQQALPDEMKAYLAKWWKITIPEEQRAEIFKSIPQGGTQQTLSPEQQKVKDLVDQTSFFSNPTFIGTEDVKGEQSYHYSVTLDKKATVDFIVKMAALQGEATPTAAEIADMNKTFETLDLTGDVYIGTVSGVLNKFSGTLKLNKVGDTETTGTVNVSITLGGVNQPVTLEEPAGAEEFPVDQIMGAMAGGVSATGDTSGLTSDTTSDTSADTSTGISE